MCARRRHAFHETATIDSLTRLLTTMPANSGIEKVVTKAFPRLGNAQPTQTPSGSRIAAESGS